MFEQINVYKMLLLSGQGSPSLWYPWPIKPSASTVYKTYRQLSISQQSYTSFSLPVPRKSEKVFQCFLSFCNQALFVTYIFHVPEELELLKNDISSTPVPPPLANTGIISTFLASFCFISALIMLDSRSGVNSFQQKYKKLGLPVNILLHAFICLLFLFSLTLFVRVHIICQGNTPHLINTLVWPIHRKIKLFDIPVPMPPGFTYQTLPGRE
jgi:hypothetical protein